MAERLPLPGWLSLAGRTAVVSGAGSPNGIGVAVARCLRDLGADVVLGATTDRVHERATELGGSAVVGDLTTESDAAALVAHAVARTGRLDVVVANAGMVSALDGDYLEGDLTATTPERWRASIGRNLDTAYLLCRAALPALRASGSGRIVLVSSVTGAAMAMRGDIAYAAAKAGLVGLARALAVDEAASGVTVNVVAPGWIATGSQTASEVIEGALVPAGRSGTPGEVAAAIAWLCTPGAAYTTGQVLLVDGGNSVGEERAGR